MSMRQFKAQLCFLFETEGVSGPASVFPRVLCVERAFGNLFTKGRCFGFTKFQEEDKSLIFFLRGASRYLKSQQKLVPKRSRIC